MSFTFFETRTELELSSKNRQQMLYLGDREFLARVLGKYAIHLDADDTSLTPSLAMDGFWEAWITLALGRMLRPGSYYVDVGANCGYYSVLMADALQGEGRLAAVEANPRLAGLLEKTMKANGLDKVTKVVQKVATDGVHGNINLIIPEATNLGGASICRQQEDGDAVVEVRTTSIDELTKSWPRVDLVKIDAEGAEPNIWQGMKKTVEKNENLIVLMEFNQMRYDDGKELLEDIISKGFPLRYIDYDSEIKEVTIDVLMDPDVKNDWMLFLQK